MRHHIDIQSGAEIDKGSSRVLSGLSCLSDIGFPLELSVELEQKIGV
jgi:hypothetical protein